MSGSNRKNIRVVVVGDPGTGKSTLILKAATGTFQKVPRVVRPTRLSVPDRVPLTIIDTFSSSENRYEVDDEMCRADVIVLTYAFDQPSSIENLPILWFQKIHDLQIKSPVIVVGCKADKRSHPIGLAHLKIEKPHFKFVQCSTVLEQELVCTARLVFYYAQKAVLYPMRPLYDHAKNYLQSRCVGALKRIFLLLDQDKDGHLNEEEFKELQIKCFNAPLSPVENLGLLRLLQRQPPEGEVLGQAVDAQGLTFDGFLWFHRMMVQGSRREITWTMLRNFGYNDELKLRDDFLSIPVKKAPDQSLELTGKAMAFLEGIFSTFADESNILESSALERLFSTAPESPWKKTPYKDAVERTTSEGLSLSAFLSEWALMTLLEPAQSFANLSYIGYNDDGASALCLTRRRSVDRKKKQSSRNVYQCFIFGAKKSGKSSLLESFLGRPLSENYVRTTDERYAVKVVDMIDEHSDAISDLPMATKKNLVLREIPEDRIQKLISNKESLASCDVAVFVYDSSDGQSFETTLKLLEIVATQGEISGFMVPSLLVAAKNDLNSFAMEKEVSTQICRNFGIAAPIRMSVNEGNVQDVFKKIIAAAKNPDINIPETEIGRSEKRYKHLVHRSLKFTSVVAAVAVVGLVTWRFYAAHKNAST